MTLQQYIYDSIRSGKCQQFFLNDHGKFLSEELIQEAIDEEVNELSNLDMIQYIDQYLAQELTLTTKETKNG